MLGALIIAACGEGVSQVETSSVDPAPINIVDVQDSAELMAGSAKLVVEIPTVNSSADLQEAGKAIENRLKAFGFEKIQVSLATNNDLNLIIHPDEDIDRIKDVLHAQSNLGFHVVHNGSDDPRVMDIALKQGLTPAGTILKPYAGYQISLLIVERTRINQDCIRSLEAGIHPESNRPVMNFVLDSHCTRLFGKLTSENVGKRFAVLLDDTLITAPTIWSPIMGGRGYIEGWDNSMSDVREIAALLETSRLLNGIQIVEEKTLKE